MRKNLAGLGLAAGMVAVAVMTISARAVSGQAPDDALVTAVEAVAALPGLPSTASAAGITPAGQRILTLEPTSWAPSPVKRLVIVGGLDGTAESPRAVLEALRWFKTEAPAEIRRAWSIRAVPCAYPEQCLAGSSAGAAAAGLPAGAAAGLPASAAAGLPAGATAGAAARPAVADRALGNARTFPPEGGFYNDETAPETRYLWRWVAFQSPDLVLEVRSGPNLTWEISGSAAGLPLGAPPLLDGPPPPDGTLAAAVSVGTPSGLAPVAAVRASTSVDDAPQMLRTLLDAAASLRRSSLHDAILARLSRTPVEIATILANRYPTSPAMSYISAVAWSNTLRLAARLGDATLVEKVRSQMAPFLSGESPTVTEPYRLTSLAALFAFMDFSGPGQSEEALNVAIAGSEFMFAQSPDEILRSPTGWTDDMFMASSLLSRVGARTGDPRYAATVGRLLTSYAESLQRSDGLFVHSARGPHAWGRANGFAILGLTEALTFLPENWAERDRVLDIYRRHAEALARHQAPDGMWQQVVDEPGSYRELTVTAMTVVALARGVRLGWLDDSYGPLIERAWLGIAARIAEDGAVVDASTSTGAGETKQYYLDRTAIFGPDDRGGAMALWAAMEMDELRR